MKGVLDTFLPLAEISAAVSARQALLIIDQDQLMRKSVSRCLEDDLEVDITRRRSKAPDDHTTKAFVS